MVQCKHGNSKFVVDYTRSAILNVISCSIVSFSHGLVKTDTLFWKHKKHMGVVRYKKNPAHFMNKRWPDSGPSLQHGGAYFAWGPLGHVPNKVWGEITYPFRNFIEAIAQLKLVYWNPRGDMFGGRALIESPSRIMSLTSIAHLIAVQQIISCGHFRDLF